MLITNFAIKKVCGDGVIQYRIKAIPVDALVTHVARASADIASTPSNLDILGSALQGLKVYVHDTAKIEKRHKNLPFCTWKDYCKYYHPMKEKQQVNILHFEIFQLEYTDFTYYYKELMKKVM